LDESGPRALDAGYDRRTFSSGCAIDESKDIWYVANRPGPTRNPEYLGVDNVKRLMGRDSKDGQLLSDIKKFKLPFQLDGKGRPVLRTRGCEVRPEELMALSFLYAQAVAEKATGQKPTECVATVPAYFTDAQRLATINAAKIASVKIRKIVNEPTAVAAAYLWNSKKYGFYVVLDSGGGTTDGSLVEFSESNGRRVLTVKATSGDNALGGLDFTHDLVGVFREKFRDEINVPDDQLFTLCDEAKQTDSNTLQIVVGAKAYEIGQDVYRKALQSNLQRVENVLLDVLGALRGRELQSVILAGGSSYHALLREHVTELLHRRKIPILPFRYPPAEVVALGAAVLTDPDGILLTDITNRSLGIECQSTRESLIDLMDFLIKKHTPLPVRETRVYIGAPGGTTAISLFEGEHSKASLNVFLGSFFIKVAAGQEFILAVTAGDDGMVKVEAFEQKGSVLGSGLEVRRVDSELGGEELERMQSTAKRRFESKNLVAAKKDIVKEGRGKRRAKTTEKPKERTAKRAKRGKRY
jgi:molecular chaperone DnaK (HSP70)